MKSPVFEENPNFQMKRLIDYLQIIRKNDEYLDRLLSKVLKEAHKSDDESPASVPVLQSQS